MSKLQTSVLGRLGGRELSDHFDAMVGEENRKRETNIKDKDLRVSKMRLALVLGDVATKHDDGRAYATLHGDFGESYGVVNFDTFFDKWADKLKASHSSDKEIRGKQAFEDDKYRTLINQLAGGCELGVHGGGRVDITGKL